MEAKPGLTSDGSQKREIQTRQRASTSCTECRRRKQKCNQAKDKPCNNCARRYPPVPCTYGSFRKTSKYKESIIDLKVIETKLEESESDDSGFSSPIYEIESPLDQVFQHGLPQAQTQRENSSSDQTVPLGFHDFPVKSVPPDEDEIRDEDTSSEDVVVARSGQYNPEPKSHSRSEYERTSMDGGGVAMELLEVLPIEYNVRNARLFKFFANRLSPFMSSIDGSGPPASFTSQWLPFVTQSPIAIHVAILSAAYFEAASRNVDVEKSIDAISSKVKLITLINEHIGGHGSGVSDESIAAVMSLASNESIYSDQRSTMAHMRGLRDMIQTRGGIDSISFGLLRKMLLRTDYQIASTYECEVVLDSSREHPIPVLKSFPLELDSPILQSHIPFADLVTVHKINNETARILDDTRSLTVSVLRMSGNDVPLSKRDKMLAGIHSIHQKLSSSPVTNPNSPEDFIYQACRSTAIIYSSAILTRTPLSISCTPHLFQQLWKSMWRVPLQRWKQIPGIFIWILLVASPFARDKPEGRFFKALTPATTMAMGLIDWDTVMGALKGFLAVQRWLGGDLRGVVLPVRGSAALRTPEGGLPAWTLSEASVNTISYGA
ncbi:hypothetical protein DL98DRAFT_661640 [Cadophora sp. DSE1049]|nr:hypothetical protein DL98DRAFT_661640 [Cadophora sp. DSE1049]